MKHKFATKPYIALGGWENGNEREIRKLYTISIWKQKRQRKKK